MNPDQHQQLINEIAVAVEALDRALDHLIQTSEAPLGEEPPINELPGEPQMDFFFDDSLPPF